ncbi:hypothetical protein MC885_020587, partial [Smutsia gigantea]
RVNENAVRHRHAIPGCSPCPAALCCCVLEPTSPEGPAARRRAALRSTAWEAKGNRRAYSDPRNFQSRPPATPLQPQHDQEEDAPKKAAALGVRLAAEAGNAVSLCSVAGPCLEGKMPAEQRWWHWERCGRFVECVRARASELALPAPKIKNKTAAHTFLGRTAGPAAPPLPRGLLLCPGCRRGELDSRRRIQVDSLARAEREPRSCVRGRVGAGRQARGSEGRSRVEVAATRDARLRGRHTPTRVDPCHQAAPWPLARPTARGGELGRVGVEGTFRAPGRRPLPSGPARLVLAALHRRGGSQAACMKGAAGKGPR